VGIEKSIVEYEKLVLYSLGLEYKGLKWCELGNQINYKNEVAKKVYQSLGVEHTSIDINGKNGALPINLDKPVPTALLDRFDVITNYGTIEHVNNQYQVFKNVHDMCKKGGIMIHVFPLKGHWPRHCRYYYSEVFVKGLANASNYRIINYTILDKDDYKTPNNLIAVTYIKKENNKFISKEEFDQIGGILDTGGLEFTGNYANEDYNAFISVARKLPSPIRRIGKKFIRNYANEDYNAFISVARKLPSPIRRIGKKFIRKLAQYLK